MSVEWTKSFIRSYKHCPGKDAAHKLTVSEIEGTTIFKLKNHSITCAVGAQVDAHIYVEVVAVDRNKSSTETSIAEKGPHLTTTSESGNVKPEKGAVDHFKFLDTQK